MSRIDLSRRSVALGLIAMAGCEGSGGGAGPKIVLRYHPPAGAVYHYSLAQRTGVTIQSGPLGGLGKQELRMSMHFTQTIKGSVAGGTEVEVVFDSTTMAMPGVTADRIAAELAKMRGVKSTVVFDERAQIVRSDFERQPGMTPEMANQMGAGLKAMTFEFPKQALGRGDSWTVSTELPLAQIPGTDASRAGAARTTLTVRDIRVTGADTTVLLDITTQFPSGPIQLTVAGQQGTLRINGELTGNQRFSLSRGAVIEATLNGATTMNVTTGLFGTKPIVMLSEIDNALQLVDGK